MKNTAQYIFSRLTFKRFVILFILFLIAIPILKGVFSDVSKEDEVVLESRSHEYKFLKGEEYSDNRILVIPISGVILTESVGTDPLAFLAESQATYGYDVKDMLVRAADENRIKGILLQINSPGGTIAGSKAIADGIEYYRKQTGNPVIAHIRDVGASGAYWAAIVADKVLVDTGSIIGSIGVLMGPFKYYNSVVEEGSFLGSVSTEEPIETSYFTGGQYKDTGSPYRRLTDEEKTHWQNMINSEYNIFVNHVSKYRSIPQNVIISQVKALPYGAEQARNLNLIDQIGSEENAVTELLLRMRVSKDDYQMIYEKEKTDIWEEIFSVATKVQKPQAATVCALCNTPLFLYDSTYSVFK